MKLTAHLLNLEHSCSAADAQKDSLAPFARALRVALCSSAEACCTSAEELPMVCPTGLFYSDLESSISFVLLPIARGPSDPVMQHK